MSTLGKRVRHARKQAGLSQAELAQRIGVKQPTIADLETGESKSTRYILDIARITGTSPDWLATGRGLMASSSPYLAEFANLPEDVQRAILDIAKTIMDRRVA